MYHNFVKTNNSDSDHTVAKEQRTLNFEFAAPKPSSMFLAVYVEVHIGKVTPQVHPCPE